MVWGAIAFNFKSPLIWVKKKLNSEKYINILNDNLIFEQLDQRFGKFSYVFQQDGASSHRAKNTMNFLNSKVKHLTGDPKWPANSPDLNVIEMLWAIIKSRLNVEGISTQEELFLRIKQIWDEIPLSTINLLIQSFDSRLKTCIAINGESLNGKKKIRKMFQDSYEIGNNYVKLRNEEKIQKACFINESQRFFCHLVDDQHHCTRSNCNDSIEICKILPQRFLDKVQMPKPITKQGSSIYLPK